MILEGLSSVVSVGGGTGLSCLLNGLKHFVLDPPVLGVPQHHTPWISRLTAVVSVTDDGGSSGKLREELQVLPPGDIRNCMVAMSTDESLLSELFQYRFPGRGNLRGHSFGNLFLSAMTGVTGDFLKAIRLSSDVLSIRGRIFPSTLHDVQLEALLEDGRRVQGETLISNAKSRIKRITLKPIGARPVRDVLEALRTADLITVGPGSLFTSLIPNLLVRGVEQAIRDSGALKIYIANLMTQPGETDGLSLADHIEAIHSHLRGPLFDLVVLNRRRASPASLARYEAGGAYPVRPDIQRVRQMGIRIHGCDLLASGRAVRHDPLRLAVAIRQASRHLRPRPARQR